MGVMLAPPRGDARVAEHDELAAFLARIGHDVDTALRARRALLAELLNARHDPPNALARAGRAGRRCVRAFDEALQHLHRMRVPGPASECAFELREWLEAHVAACDHLSRAAAARDHQDLALALHCLAEGACSAARFNCARERLLRRLAS
jgi:hypothetical protein